MKDIDPFQDPFDEFLQDATSERDDHERLVMQFSITWNDLELAFMAHEDILETDEHLLGTLARQLARIQIIDDSDEKHQKEKEFLAHLQVNHLPIVAEIIQDCHPIAPLAEEDAPLLAEAITKKEVRDAHMRTITTRVDEIIRDYEIITGEETEIDDDDTILYRLLEYYEYVVYDLDESSDKTRELINLQESTAALTVRLKLPPIFQQIINTLVHEATP